MSFVILVVVVVVIVVVIVFVIAIAIVVVTASLNNHTSSLRCACNDLGTILYDLPIIPSVAFSAQWGDPQTWCAISNAINALMEILSIVLKLLIQLLQAILSLISPHSPYAQVNFTRPDFSKATELFCHAFTCAARSFENAFQRFWDDYIPFEFNFTDYLTILEVAGCLAVKTANWVLTLVANIDRVVQYPTDPFWESVMKPMTVENINLFAAPSQWPIVYAPSPPAPLRFTMSNYYLGKNTIFDLFFTKCVIAFFSRHQRQRNTNRNIESSLWSQTIIRRSVHFCE